MKSVDFYLKMNFHAFFKFIEAATAVNFLNNILFKNILK